MAVSKPHQKRIRQQNGYNEYRYERYESYPPSLLDREQHSKAFRVKFFKNRDALHKGIVLSISEKMFPSMDSLMNHLNNKIDTPQGVMYIFRLEDGKLIQNIKEFQPGDECVVSSTLKIDRRIQYGQISGPPSPTKRGLPIQRSQGSSREHVLRGSHTGGMNRSPNQAKSKPLTFTVINNTMRSVQDKMIINPHTEQSFEQMLADMGEVVNMLDNPATALYCAVPPYTKIESFSNLRHELVVKKVDSFFVVGGEGAPKELRQKKVPVREPTPPPEDDMDYYEEPPHHQTYREPSPQRQKERGKWKPAKEPQRKHQNNRPNQNGYNDDKNQNGFVDDRTQPRHRGNQKSNTITNKPTAQSQKVNTSREDRGPNNRSQDLRRSNDSLASKPAREARHNQHEKEPPKHRNQRSDTQDSNRYPAKSQPARPQKQSNFEEERDMEVDEGEEEMQHNGYHDEVDNRDDAYADDNGEETEDEYDDEPPQQRPARKGPRMETPEC